MNKEEDTKLADMVQKAAKDLGEHFDSVRIVATRHVDDQSRVYSFGAGCRFAQHGCVRDWLIRSDESTRAHQRQEIIQDKEEGEDDDQS